MLLLNFARCWLYFKPSSGWWFGTCFIFPYIAPPHNNREPWCTCSACVMRVQCLCDEVRVQCLCDECAVLVCARVHERYYPTPPHPPPSPPQNPKRLLCRRWGENGVATEGKSGAFWCHIWGRFGVTTEGLTFSRFWQPEFKLSLTTCCMLKFAQKETLNFAVPWYWHCRWGHWPVPGWMGVLGRLSGGSYWDSPVKCSEVCVGHSIEIDGKPQISLQFFFC